MLRRLPRLRRTGSMRCARIIAVAARRRRNAEGLEGFGGHDPRRDGRGKALGQEWAERLVLPRLDVARGPVVDDAVAEDVCARVGDRDRYAEVVAWTDERADLHLVIEAARRRERRRRPFADDLPARPPNRRAADDDRRRAAVIADRNPLVV